jgi:DNA-binding transcriptional LysR family regulator
MSIRFPYTLYPMQINLNQLRVFYLAAREENMTRAADILCISQPAVTMQIKALEYALGLKLIRKSGKDFQLTEVGDDLFAYAVKIFDIVDEMEHSLKGHTELTKGSLTLGTTRSFARHLMPGLLSRFQERYPGVKVSLKVGSSREIADGLIAFKYDLGIIGRIPYGNRLKSLPYTKEVFCVVTPPGHRFAKNETISLQELQNEPLIIREAGSGSRYAILSLLRSHDISPSFLVEAGSVEFIKEYVIQGRGISILYRPEVEREAERGLMHCLCLQEGPILVQTDIVFPKDMELSPPAQAFLRLTEEKAGDPVV